MNINDDLHWFLDGEVIYDSDTNRAFLNMTHDEFERRLREIDSMDIKMNSGTEGELRLKRGRGRPSKDSNEAVNHLLFKDEFAAAFREAKAEYEKTMPYKLTNGQFMMTLVHNFQQRQ